MKRTSRLVALALIYIAAPLSGWAHHSSAMHDEHKTITVKGIVKRIEWSNPHGYSDEKMHPDVNCVPFPAPVCMSTPDLKRISTRGDKLIIEGEFDGALRTVELGKSSFVTENPLRLLGGYAMT